MPKACTGHSVVGQKSSTREGKYKLQYYFDNDDTEL